MLTPEFSEFTFGYAFTENFVKGWIGGGVVGVPIFPSLNEEGKLEVGYDVAIPTHGEPILFQFKIPQIVRRRSRLLPPNFGTPYYRMHLQPGAKSSQHKALVQHAKLGRRVYYVSTKFHLFDDFNRMYRACEVPDYCTYFKPDDIGPLDDSAHFVAYEESAQTAWLFSDPIEIAPPLGSEELRSEIQMVGRRAPRLDSRGEIFAKLSDDLLNTLRRSVAVEETQGPPPMDAREQPTLFVYEKLRDFPARDLLALAEETSRIEEPLTRFVALATLVLDCYVVVVGHNDEPRP